VVEHTIVESFAGRIRDDVLVSELAAQVEPALANALPEPGHYRLVLEPVALPSRQELVEIADSLCEWARSKAPLLKVGTPQSAPRHIATEVLAPWGLRVRLERWPGRDGQVRLFRSAPEDLKDLRG
jgi:hypothetical protein